MQHLPMIEAAECIDACIEAAAMCREALALGLGATAAYLPEHLRTLADCSDVCQMTAALLTRESDFRADVCRLTAEVCKVCAQSCRHFATHELMLCAERCEDAADACETLAVALTWRYRPMRAIPRSMREDDEMRPMR
jgi:hypothetical protein